MFHAHELGRVKRSRGRARSRGPVSNISQIVAAFVSRSGAWVFDAATTSTFTNLGTTPAVIGDPVRRIAGNFDAPADANRATLQTRYLGFATDKRYDADATIRGLLNAKSAIVVAGRVMFDAAALNDVISFSTGASNTAVRFRIGNNASNSFNIGWRRQDADGFSAIFVNTSVVPGEYAAFVGYLDFATGIGFLRCNGVENTGTPTIGAFSATNTLRCRLGSDIASTPASHLNGRVSRLLIAPAMATPAELAALKVWSST